VIIRPEIVTSSISRGLTIRTPHLRIDRTSSDPAKPFDRLDLELRTVPFSRLEDHVRHASAP
jgi:hypothetical protein